MPVLPRVLCRFEAEVELVLRGMPCQAVLHRHRALCCLWTLREHHSVGEGSNNTQSHTLFVFGFNIYSLF